MTEIDAFTLSVILDKGTCHGLEVGEGVAERFKRELGPGSLYRSLHRSEQRGYLKAFWEDAEEADHQGPPRRYYEITGTGADALDEYIEKLRSTMSALRLAEG